jgi:hypothetical protein
MCTHLHSTLADTENRRGTGSMSRKPSGGAAFGWICHREQTGSKQDADREQSEVKNFSLQTLWAVPGTLGTLPETARNSIPCAAPFRGRRENRQAQRRLLLGTKGDGAWC